MQGERESYCHRKHILNKTMVEGINPITTQKNTKIEFRILAAMDNCSDLVRPRQHVIANTKTWSFFMDKYSVQGGKVP